MCTAAAAFGSAVVQRPPGQERERLAYWFVTMSGDRSYLFELVKVQVTVM